MCTIHQKSPVLKNMAEEYHFTIPHCLPNKAGLEIAKTGIYSLGPDLFSNAVVIPVQSLRLQKVIERLEQ
jgi:hypothetical protein